MVLHVQYWLIDGPLRKSDGDDSNRRRRDRFKLSYTEVTKDMLDQVLMDECVVGLNRKLNIRLLAHLDWNKG